MESHWIRALIGMELNDAKKRAWKEGLSRGMMDIKTLPIHGTKKVEWPDDRMPRTIRIQYSAQNNKVLDARIG